MAVGDSALIAKHFQDIGVAEDLNGRLDAAGKAQDMALRALMEDRLYFFNVGHSFLELSVTQTVDSGS